MKKNEKKDRNFKRGISLIVLVITIIVIIILAAAVMLSIDNNNPIENAKKAKNDHNESVYQEEIELYALNEYSNGNISFNKNALNAFNGYNVKKIITSMLDEDVEKYIIWQGKLVKKDGEKYVYLNGEQVMMFGENGQVEEQVALTENRLKFAKEFEKIQEENSDVYKRLIYNGGYITNCVDYTSESSYKFCTTVKFKEKLPSNVIVKIPDESKESSDTYQIGTDNKIFYSGSDELLAKTVFFGDVATSEYTTINLTDSNFLRNMCRAENPYATYNSAVIIAADINGDGIVNVTDSDILANNTSSILKFVNQNRPAIMPRF